MFNIIQARKIWLCLSGLLIVASVLALIFWGLRLGIDFTGGSLLEVEFLESRPASETIQAQLDELKLKTLQLQPTGEKGLLIRTTALSEEQHQLILEKIDSLFGEENTATVSEPTAGQTEKTVTVPASAIGLTGEGTENLSVDISGTNLEQLGLEGIGVSSASASRNFTELRFDSIGPTIGNELKRKSFYAIIVVLLAIILYIAYAFRKVSKPVESWIYGLSAIIALAHDIFIVTGLYAIFGHFFDFQADALFVTALLTILGFSVHDTIVTFDRIRENLHRHQDETFMAVVNRSVNETIVRSLNTSLTTLFVLLSVYLFGGDSIKNFVLTLMLGLIIGTYSSIFIASPLLVIWNKLKKN